MYYGMFINQKSNELQDVPLAFFKRWVEENRLSWPKDPNLSEELNECLRKEIYAGFCEDDYQLSTSGLFRHLRKCTVEQLAHFMEHLQSHRMCLHTTKLARFIEDFGEAGTLQKIRILFPNMTWRTFVLEGASAALLSQWMPQYMDDILTWYREEECCSKGENVKPQAFPPHEESSTIMRLKLQLSSEANDVVCQQMKKLPAANLDDKTVVAYAIEPSIETIFDVAPDMRASYLYRLREGWGIRYPAALLTIVVQEMHGKSFKLPPPSTLCYTDAPDDAALAALFSNQQMSNAQASDVLQLGQIVHNLYGPDQWRQFCLHGPQAFFGYETTQPAIELAGLLQDVGHP